jgi:ectoine hydroxylase-related dioxygenase (phytanoyl-CoA dioxygenase family)
MTALEEIRARLPRLAEDGYFTIPNLFADEELDDLEALTDRAIAHHNRDYPNPTTPYQYVTRKDGFTVVNELADDSGVAPSIREFAKQPRIRDVARAIAGVRAAHYFFQIVYKHPHYQGLFPWHQDHMHTPSDEPFFNVWVALSDMTEENGCIRIMPRVGMDRVLTYHDTPHGKSCWPLEERGVPIILDRGSALVLTSKTLHMSGANDTDAARKAMLMVFMDRERTVNGQRLELQEYPE